MIDQVEGVVGLFRESVCRGLDGQDGGVDLQVQPTSVMLLLWSGGRSASAKTIFS